MRFFSDSLNSKLPNTATSIFAVMTQMAREYDAINLSQGFPDFPVSGKLIELVSEKMKQGYNQYAPMPGVPELREQIVRKTKLLYDASYDADKEVTVTAGATQAIYAAITAFIRDEDEVIVFEPAYDSYIPAIKLNGGVPIVFRMEYPDFRIDWDEVKKLVNARTRMIIINTPHNPSGSILSAEDMNQLERLTNDSGILVLSDEVYEHILFDGHRHQSVCLYPLLAERSIIVCSFGKTFHATGWKMGYCLAPEIFMKEFRKVHQFMVFCANSPVQYALAEFLRDESNYAGLGSFYQEKRDYFLKAIQTSRFKAIPAAGTYFQLLDYSDISDEPEMEFATRMVKEYKVAMVPTVSFYNKAINQNILRVCFAKSEDTLDQAAGILCNI